MSAHIAEEIPRLLTGEASHASVLAAAEHLRGCPDCQQELVSAVVAHASLASARRFAPEVVSARPRPRETSDEGPAPLPDLSAVFAQVRSEVATDTTSPATPPSSRPATRSTGEPIEAPTTPSTPRTRRLATRHRILAVAAAVLVLGGGTAAVTAALQSGSSGRSVALDAYGAGHHKAEATLTGTRLHIDASTLPATAPNRRYEVWLTDSARDRMLPVGFMGTDRRMSIALPKAMLTHFSDIEVSVQRLDQDRYSGTSVLRGAYR